MGRLVLDDSRDSGELIDYLGVSILAPQMHHLQPIHPPLSSQDAGLNGTAVQGRTKILLRFERHNPVFHRGYRVKCHSHNTM